MDQRADARILNVLDSLPVVEVGKGLAGFIQKPYKLSVLRDAVRGIL